MNKVPICVIILTHNEEANLPYALDSVVGWAQQVFVVDSYSTDKTVEIAREYNARVFQNKWVDYATQRQWALTSLPIEVEWILFMDADESLTRSLKDEISRRIFGERNIDGFFIKRKFIFLGKWVKYGSCKSNRELRLARKESLCISETRGSFESYSVKGATAVLDNYMLHEDRRGIGEWINKHNKYSSLNSEFIVNGFSYRKVSRVKAILGSSKKFDRTFLKEILLFTSHGLWKPFVLFFYRYIIQFGFLDGKKGFIYHFLHDFWYPLLIEAKVIELLNRQENVD